MTTAECDRLVALAMRCLHPALLMTGTPDYRTNTSADVELLRDPFTVSIQERIGAALGYPWKHGEGLQVQHYLPGQEFREHTDAFWPNTPEEKCFGGAAGRRTWTFMIYLNRCARGGQTYFPRKNVSIDPRPGLAVFWWNLTDDGLPDLETTHAGLPVIAGEKTIVTDWFRERSWRA